MTDPNQNEISAYNLGLIELQRSMTERTIAPSVSRTIFSCFPFYFLDSLPFLLLLSFYPDYLPGYPVYRFAGFKGLSQATMNSP
jgi:hypothetical protein